MQKTTYYDAMLRARMWKEMSRAELSRRSGVNVTMLYNYETGKTVPGLLAVMSLADALGVSIDNYVGYRRRDI